MKLNQRLYAAISVMKTLVTTVVAVTAIPLASLAQTVEGSGPGPGPFGPGSGCNFFPPSAAIGAAVDPSYFGPPPSSTKPDLTVLSLVQQVQSLTVQSCSAYYNLPASVVVPPRVSSEECFKIVSLLTVPSKRVTVHVEKTVLS